MSAQEKTDLKKAISSFKISEKAGKITSSLKWTSEQKWAVLMGSVLLGGTAFVAGQSHAKGSWGATAGSDEGAAASDSTGTEQPALAPGVDHKVAGGTISPGTGVNISSSHVNDQMSFAEAFNEARAECGPGSIFEWRGNVYNTYYQEEWVRLTAEDKQEFLKNVGFKPDVSHTGNGHSNPDTIEIKSESSEDDENTPDPEPMEFGDYRIVEYEGQQHLLRDFDHDGVIDEVMTIGIEEGVVWVRRDYDGDGVLDTSYFEDTQGGTSPENPMEEPSMITISQIDSGEYGEVIETGVLYTPEEEEALVNNFRDSAEASAPIEDVYTPVDSITDEVVITDQPPIEDDENYDNDIHVV